MCEDGVGLGQAEGRGRISSSWGDVRKCGPKRIDIPGAQASEHGGWKDAGQGCCPENHVPQPSQPGGNEGLIAQHLL